MTRQKRKWHTKFKKYMKFIVNHPNYRGMPQPYKKDDSVRWVVTANSKIGVERIKWWDKQRKRLGINKGGQWKSKVARKNHPTGSKPCQICGRIMKLNYVYPNRITISKLNKIQNLKIKFKYEDFLTIEEVSSKILRKLKKDFYKEIAKIFKIPDVVKKSQKKYLDYILTYCKTKLSPGVMSDSPDRFDGFHSYNICCRQRENAGRHEEKMATYVEDRRAYELWSGGDWKAAAWLMSEFRKKEIGICKICGNKGQMTADHIGPISLGFSQRIKPKFHPLCWNCNVGRRNRLTLSDVKMLIQDDKNGEQVITWHSKLIWDKIKNLVKSDKDAEKLSKLMRKNMHHVLIILSDIAASGFKIFLVSNFLHPEYAYYYINFIGFNPETGEYKKIKKIKGVKKQYRNNAERYIRKSLEALEKYQSKKNRKVKKWRSKEVDKFLKTVINLMRKGKEKEALGYLYKALDILAENALKDFLSN